MENEHLNGGPKPDQEGSKGQKVDADDLKFIRSVIEKTCRKIDPGWPIMIVWGLVFLIVFPVVYYLKINQLDQWMWPVQWLVLVLAIGTTIYFGANARLRERKTGVISKLSKQIYLIWFILQVNLVIWICLGLFKDHLGGFGFLLSAIYGIGLSMMGILYSREWLYGGIAIFAGIIAASFTEPYAYAIIGITTGLACIIPAIIAQRNYRKQEKSYE
jgi:hypothetical protein